VIGDMLIPVAMYFFYRVLKERDQIFAGLFIFSFAGLLYTHHLSAFCADFLNAAVVILYLILKFQKRLQNYQ